MDKSKTKLSEQSKANGFCLTGDISIDTNLKFCNFDNAQLILPNTFNKKNEKNNTKNPPEYIPINIRISIRSQCCGHVAKWLEKLVKRVE